MWIMWPPTLRYSPKLQNSQKTLTSLFQFGQSARLILQRSRERERNKERNMARRCTEVYYFHTLPAWNTTQSHLSLQLNTSWTDSGAVTFHALTRTFIMKSMTGNSSELERIFETHFKFASPYSMWGLEHIAVECPTAVMSEFWFMTFLTLPGCLLPASQPLVSLISLMGLHEER